MKEKIKVIKDPDVFKVCLEDNRCQILSILKYRDMSVTEMAETLHRDYSTIFRHVKKLEKYGFLAIVAESRRKRTPELIYGRTAEIFIPALHTMEMETLFDNSILWKKEQAIDLVRTLEKMGYTNNGSKEMAEDIYDLFQCYTRIVTEKMVESGIGSEDLSFFNLMRIRLIVLLLEMEINQELQKHIEKIKNNCE